MMKRTAFFAALACAGVLSTVAASAALPADLERDARAAMAKGAAWLASLQQDAGHWDMAETPALTALSMWALQRADAETYREVIDKGQQEEGGGPGRQMKEEAL